MKTNITDLKEEEKTTKITENYETPNVYNSTYIATNGSSVNTQSKILPVPGLRTLYNSFDMSDYTMEKLRYERLLYAVEKQKYTGTLKSFLSTLPKDNPLIQILICKQSNLLYQWQTKMIPVGGNRKDDPTIISDLRTLRVKDVSEVLRQGTDGKWDVLWDFCNLDSGLNQWFPEMLNVNTLNGSVIDCLKKENLKEFIYGYESKILNNPKVKIDDNNFFNIFKQMCRLSTGTQPVGNFPAMVGMFIIQDEYFHTLSIYRGIPNDHFVVLNPCSGWGSRLLSTLCVFHNLREDYYNRYGKQLHVTYLSTDPNTLVHDRFQNIVLDWFESISPEDNSEYFHLEKKTLGCETPEFLAYCKSVLNYRGLSGVNVAFTSPPYFNREKYSDDVAQSYIQYSTYPEWRDNFLSGMISNVNELLLPGGRFYLNIANTLEPGGHVNSLESDSCECFKKFGMKEVITYKMVIGGSSDSAHKVRVEGHPEHKYEPVFVYEKVIK